MVSMMPGCIIIPTLEHHTSEYDTRGIIEEETISFFRNLITTREDVLLNLGEPEYAWEGGRKFVYRWKSVHAYLVYAFGYAGGVQSLGGEYLLLIQFDTDNRILRYEIVSGRFSEEIKRW
jgi:hypothetical protein